MSDFKRLFEIPYYQKAMFPKDDMLNGTEKGEWRKASTLEVIEKIESLACGLIESGLNKEDKVAIISNSRTEWNLVDLAVQLAGGITVPIYPTLSERETEYILNDAEIKIIFAEGLDLAEKIERISRDKSTALFTFIKEKSFNHWKTLLTDIDSDKLLQKTESIQPDDIATILYTSGTTGDPKGVMLSHKNIISNIKAIISIVPLEEGRQAYSFLPLSHIFERMVTYSYMATGTPIYYATDLESIAEELKYVKPYYFTAVPRLLEKTYEKILARGMELKGFKKRLFDWALDMAENYSEEMEGSFKLKWARKLVFRKWQEALGGNVIAIVTGAAALPAHLGKIFAAADIAIREGYGLTETSPVIAVNRFEAGGFRFGTVGMVIPGVDVRIAEDGEILVKGPNVMKGYYKRDDLTAAVIDKDGWFHTGDIGEMEDERFLKITDRKKSLFKTSGGKYVAPQVIEMKMSESQFIEQILVLGSNRKYVSALIVPNRPLLKKWVDDEKIAYTTWDELLRHPKVIEMYQDVIEIKNDHFGRTEQIKKFELLTDEWNIEAGEMTPTMKLKRKIIEEKYSQVIEKMYS